VASFAVDRGSGLLQASGEMGIAMAIYQLVI